MRLKQRSGPCRLSARGAQSETGGRQLRSRTGCGRGRRRGRRRARPEPALRRPLPSRGRGCFGQRPKDADRQARDLQTPPALLLRADRASGSMPRPHRCANRNGLTGEVALQARQCACAARVRPTLQGCRVVQGDPAGAAIREETQLIGPPQRDIQVANSRLPVEVRCSLCPKNPRGEHAIEKSLHCACSPFS